jgi:uncharacterized Tic20 family protein
MSNPYESPKTPPEINSSELTPEAKQMAMLAHLLGALFGFLGPLIIWLTQKDKHPFIDDQGKEALNFQLTVLIVAVVCIIGTIVSCGFLFFLPFIPMILQLVFGIIRTVKANNGEAYRYPMSIHFIK